LLGTTVVTAGLALAGLALPGSALACSASLPCQAQSVWYTHAFSDQPLDVMSRVSGEIGNGEGRYYSTATLEVDVGNKWMKVGYNTNRGTVYEIGPGAAEGFEYETGFPKNQWEWTMIVYSAGSGGWCEAVKFLSTVVVPQHCWYEGLPNTASAAKTGLRSYGPVNHQGGITVTYFVAHPGDVDQNYVEHEGWGGPHSELNKEVNDPPFAWQYPFEVAGGLYAHT
jgi:hypothetical protein